MGKVGRDKIIQKGYRPTLIINNAPKISIQKRAKPWADTGLGRLVIAVSAGIIVGIVLFYLNLKPNIYPSTIKPTPATSKENEIKKEPSRVVNGPMVQNSSKDHSISSNEQQRRSAVVQELLNDYVMSHDGIEPTYQGRLNQAESYINAQLISRGEKWHFDAKTRTMKNYMKSI